jgi:hypothetical protein
VAKGAEAVIEQEPRFWTPPSLPRFKVGDRVRVRLSGECDRNGKVSLWRGGRWIETEQESNHPPELDGVEGVVVEVRENSETGHPFVVMFPREPYTRSLGWVESDMYSATELELLEAAP